MTAMWKWIRQRLLEELLHLQGGSWAEVQLAMMSLLRRAAETLKDGNVAQPENRDIHEPHH